MEKKKESERITDQKDRNSEVFASVSKLPEAASIAALSRRSLLAVQLIKEGLRPRVCQMKDRIRIMMVTADSGG